jgi:protein-tyrosine phosphatase
MNQSQPFADIHCHLLPGIDDGATGWEESLRMAEMAVADGIATIIATPHQLGSFSKNSGAAIRAQATQLQEALDQRGIPLRVLPGADVRIEPELIGKLRAGEVLSLADRRRHVLLELPHDVFAPLDRLLDELRAMGMVGILSHPERNQGILNRPEVLPRLVERGCLLQVTAASLMGLFGSRISRFSESIIRQGMVHFVATDAHGVTSRPPLLQDAFQRVVELVGIDTATALCCHNPACVANGEAVKPGICRPIRPSWTSRLIQSFSSASVQTRQIKEYAH